MSKAKKVWVLNSIEYGVLGVASSKKKAKKIGKKHCEEINTDLEYRTLIYFGDLWLEGYELNVLAS